MTQKNKINKKISSYILFCKDERTNIKNENSELNNKEVMIELNIRWNKLKEEKCDKFKYYENLSNKLKENIDK
jgi:hypothetical protein